MPVTCVAHSHASVEHHDASVDQLHENCETQHAADDATSHAKALRYCDHVAISESPRVRGKHADESRHDWSNSCRSLALIHVVLDSLKHHIGVFLQFGLVPDDRPVVIA
jgi:hypothetical protein